MSTPDRLGGIDHKRIFVSLFVALLGGIAGYALCWLCWVDRTSLSRTVAMKWGDGKYGPAFYGAHVYLQPSEGGYSVRAKVCIGPGNDYYHDCGELGRVQTHAEAVEQWGTITWKEDGLHIGTGGPDDFHLPRKTMETHR